MTYGESQLCLPNLKRDGICSKAQVLTDPFAGLVPSEKLLHLPAAKSLCDHEMDTIEVSKVFGGSKK
jgi:hypothetical protein